MKSIKILLPLLLIIPLATVTPDKKNSLEINNIVLKKPKEFREKTNL